jgi:hypothetical protein
LVSISARKPSGSTRKFRRTKKTQHRCPAYWKNVASAQSAPDCFQALDTFERGIAGIIGAVERADARSDNHIRGDTMGSERMQHAGLDGAEAATAGED